MSDSTNTTSIYRPFGPPIGIFKIDPSTVRKLKEKLTNTPDTKLSPYGHKLAGEIKKEGLISPDFFLDLGLGPILSKFLSSYIRTATGQNLKKCEFVDCWLVQQAANEYNPTHFHGGHVSGVLWLQIPSGMNSDSIKSANKLNGAISFTHGSAQFLSQPIFNFVPEEGSVAIFPHYLMHTVYPFKVKGERWSIAFNTLVDSDVYNSIR